MDRTAPWQPIGAKGKPNQHRRSKATQSEAHLLAVLRSAFHEAQTSKPNQNQCQQQQDHPGDVQLGRWAYRKPEWECPKCTTRNFLHLGACRACKEPWKPGAKTYPAGSPPPKHAKQVTVDGKMPNGTKPDRSASQPKETLGHSKPVGPPPSGSLEAAEAALASMRQAAAPVELIQQWEQEVQKRKEAAAAEAPLPLRSRLAQATADYNACTRAKENAQQRAKAARADLEQAEEQLRAAEVDEARASEALRLVTAEAAPPPDASPDTALAGLLEAVQAAHEQRAGYQDMLAQATAKGQAALHRQPASSTEDVDMAEKPLEPASAAAAADSVRLTQAGGEELAAAALEELLLRVHPSKRAQASARLTQLGVEEEQQQRQHQQQQQQPPPPPPAEERGRPVIAESPEERRARLGSRSRTP